jgi:SNF2 family DNA or RNA helicase
MFGIFSLFKNKKQTISKQCLMGQLFFFSRLKKDVMENLPEKRREIIYLDDEDGLIKAKLSDLEAELSDLESKVLIYIFNF